MDFNTKDQIISISLKEYEELLNFKTKYLEAPNRVIVKHIESEWNQVVRLTNFEDVKEEVFKKYEKEVLELKDKLQKEKDIYFNSYMNEKKELQKGYKKLKEELDAFYKEQYNSIGPDYVKNNYRQLKTIFGTWLKKK